MSLDVLFPQGLEKECLGKMCSAKAERSGVTVQMTLEPPIASQYAVDHLRISIEQTFMSIVPMAVGGVKPLICLEYPEISFTLPVTFLSHTCLCMSMP